MRAQRRQLSCVEIVEQTPGGVEVVAGRVIRAHCQLRPHPASVGEARRFVREVVTQVGAEVRLAETAELVVSEVVTNAVLHAGTAVDLAIRAEDCRVRVEVGDGSAQAPQARSYDRLVSTGRGLHILEAVVDAWGVEVVATGKTVWFELSPEHAEGERRAADAEPAAPNAGAAPQPLRFGDVEVVLLDVPLLLHAAWQMHAESLLREYVLTRLDQPDVERELKVHADLNAILSLLGDHIEAPELQSDPDALMADATEPLVSAARLVVPVPEAFVPLFGLLDETLEAAATMAESGALLTVPMQPELRALRQWLSSQVCQQAGGAPPTSWTSVGRRGGHRPPSHPRAQGAGWVEELRRVTARVLASPTPMLAADDTNRIVAVNAALVALLGYDDTSDLVGHRLVAVIPERYRQAHVAGFTLHLLTGRAPLLARPVALPMLTAAGHEVRISLAVSAQPVGERSLFLAEVRPLDGTLPGSVG